MTEELNEGRQEEAGTEGWKTAIPSDIRGHEVFNGMEKAGDVYSKLINLSENSKGTVRIPTENTSDEERSAFNKVMGVPSDITGYTIRPELPENSTYDEKMENSFKESALKHGMSADATKGIYQDMFKYVRGEAEATAKIVADNDAKAETELKTSWAGDYDGNSEKANRALSKFGDDGGVQLLEEAGLKDHPAIKKLFHNIFVKLGDDEFIGGDTTPDKKEVQRTAGGTPMLDFPSMQT